MLIMHVHSIPIATLDRPPISTRARYNATCYGYCQKRAFSHVDVHQQAKRTQPTAWGDASKREEAGTTCCCEPRYDGRTTHEGVIQMTSFAERHLSTITAMKS